MRELKKTEPNVNIVWRAFELRPEPVPTLDPKGDYLQRVWASSVYPLAESLGVEIELPPVQPRSRRAHEAAHWARRQGKFEEYNDALFRAFFQQGADIGDTVVLTGLASAMNLNGEALQHALDSNLHLNNVLADEQEARKLRLTGVPAFIADRKIALTGVQSLQSLRKFVDHARSLS